MKKTLLVLSGMPGAGKTTASQFFQKNHIPVLRMGDLTEQKLLEKHKKVLESNEARMRDELRKKYGADIYARVLIPKIKLKLKKCNLIVIEGLRSVIELELLKSLPVRIILFFIHAKKGVRLKRLKKRIKRPYTLRQVIKRDLWEKGIGTKDLKKIADELVENSETEVQFEQILLRIFQSIKHS